MRDDDDTGDDKGGEEEDGITIVGLEEGDDQTGGDEGGEGEKKGDEVDPKEGEGEKKGRETDGESHRQVSESGPSVQDLINEIRSEVKDKPKKEEDERPSIAKLDDAEIKLANMLDDEQISTIDYLKYMRNIQAHRDSHKEDALVIRMEGNRKRQTSEEGLETWAEKNAPTLLDGRSADSRAGIKFGEQILGAEKKGDMYIISEKVARIAFGVLEKGQRAGGENGENAQKAREAALKESKAREAELGSRDNRIPTDKKRGDKDAPVTTAERKALKRTGNDPNNPVHVSRYRKIKQAGASKVPIQVD